MKRFRQLFVKAQLSCFTLVEWPSVTPTVSKAGNSNKSHIAQTNKNVCVVCIQQHVGAPCGCRLELAALAARSRPRPLECRFCLRDGSHTSCDHFSLAFDLAAVFSATIEQLVWWIKDLAREVFNCRGSLNAGFRALTLDRPLPCAYCRR